MDLRLAYHGTETLVLAETGVQGFIPSEFDQLTNLGESDSIMNRDFTFKPFSPVLNVDVSLPSLP